MWPEVYNALFRVNDVSEHAPAPFEHISHETGDFWVYELRDYEALPLNEWIQVTLPKLRKLAPVLEKFPNTRRALYIATTIEFHPHATSQVRFDTEFLECVRACGAAIEHSVMMADEE